MINGKSISLCMVVYNSSEITTNAIKSVKSIVDEICIVDQGSTPEESTILKSLADIYVKTTNKANADFDRQYCYALATKDYVLALDSDECFDEEQLKKFEKLFTYDFHVIWFLFKNIIKHGEVSIDLKEILGGDDPHPRLWKRQIPSERGMSTPIMWPHEAHQFPMIASERQIFSDTFVNHTRKLVTVINTHLHRRKNINPQAQQMEKGFIRATLQKFDVKVKQEMNSLFPELKTFLKD